MVRKFPFSPILAGERPRLFSAPNGGGEGARVAFAVLRRAGALKSRIGRNGRTNAKRRTKGRQGAAFQREPPVRSAPGLLARVGAYLLSESLGS